MKRRLVSLALVCSLTGSAGCAFLTQKPPVLSPTTATAVTNALGALVTLLQARNVSPVVVAAVTDAQQAIAGDISGKNWGQILRDLMTNLYSQVPLSVQNDPKVWIVFTAIELALATVGA